MKKVLIFLLAVALAVTSMAIVIPASAEEVAPAVSDNLVEGALNAANDAGDSWSVKPGKWWSPRCEPSDQATPQIKSSNNDDGNLVWSRPADAGYKTSSIQYSTAAGALKAGKTYEITVAYKANKMGLINEAEFVLACDIPGSTTCKMVADGKWHIAQIQATTPEDYAADASTTIALTSESGAPKAVLYLTEVDLEISSFTVYETLLANELSVVRGDAWSTPGGAPGWWGPGMSTSSGQNVVTFTENGTIKISRHADSFSYAGINYKMPDGIFKANKAYELTLVYKCQGDYDASMGLYVEGAKNTGYYDLPDCDDFRTVVLDFETGDTVNESNSIWFSIISDAISADGASMRANYKDIDSEFARITLKEIESVGPYDDEGNMLKNGKFDRPVISMGGSEDWSGWANSGYVTLDTEKSVTDDGSGAVRFDGFAFGTGSTARQVEQTVNMEVGKTYVLSGFIMVDENYKGGTIDISLGGDSSPFHIGYNGSAPTEFGVWKYFEKEFEYVGDYPNKVQIRSWGVQGTSWFDEIKLVEKQLEDIPEVEGNLIEKEAAAIAEGTTLSAGWGDSPAETPAKYGYDAAASKTFDGTGSAFITLGAKKHQILNVASVDLIGGHTYEFSGWIKTSDDFATDGHGGEGATLTWGDNLPSSGWITNAADWTYVKGTFTPETSGTYSLQFRIWGAMTSAWVDEVAVVDVTVEDVVISSIDITGLDAPVIGEAPDTEVTIDTIEGAVKSYKVRWCYYADSGYTDDYTESTFGAGKYFAVVIITLNDGFIYDSNPEITLSDAEIDPVFPPIVNDEGDIEIYSKDYVLDEVSNVTVDEITVTGLDIPVAGEAPDREVTIEAPEGAVKEYIVVWYVKVGEEWEKFSGDVFDENTSYGAEVGIRLNDGFIFGREIKATLSNENLWDEVVTFADGELYIDAIAMPTDVVIPDTSDAAIIVLAVMALALAATVVFSRKRKED